MNERKINVIYFYGKNCPACDVLRKTFSEIIKKTNIFSQVNYFTVDCNESPKTAKRYHIHSIPTAVFLIGEKIMSSVPGAVTKKYIATEIERLQRIANGETIC